VPTGACEESCPSADAWVPEEGVGSFFLLTLFVEEQTQAIYQSTSVYQESAGKWAATPLEPPLRQVLDAANAGEILEAIPDTGCCGWANESDDQTLLQLHGKTLTMFDELSTYQNPDYDVSFYTENGKLSPAWDRWPWQFPPPLNRTHQSNWPRRASEPRRVAAHSQGFSGTTGG